MSLEFGCGPLNSAPARWRDRKLLGGHQIQEVKLREPRVKGADRVHTVVSQAEGDSGVEDVIAAKWEV